MNGRSCTDLQKEVDPKHLARARRFQLSALSLTIWRNLQPTIVTSAITRVVLPARLRMKVPRMNLRMFRLRPYIAYMRTRRMADTNLSLETQLRASINLLSDKQNVIIVPNAWYCVQDRPMTI